MAGEANDKINSFDAMLSFLTWREAFLKFREKKPINSSELLEKKSKKVLAEMKFLYPLEFAKSGDSSFLEDFFSQDKSLNSDESQINDEINKKIKIIDKLSFIRSEKYFPADVSLGQVFNNENIKNKIRANKNLSEFQELDKKLNNNDYNVSTLKSLDDFVESQNDHKSFHESVFLNPLNALYYTGLSALQAGIVSITNLCLPQQQKASPKVDIIKASIVKLENMPNSQGK